jgi:CBS domain-containing protein
MQVKDAMTEGVIGVPATTSLLQAITMMLRSHISTLPVFDANDSLVGILSEGDLRQRNEPGTQQHRPRWLKFLLGEGMRAEAHIPAHGWNVEEVMTQGAISVAENASLREAVDLMNRHKIKRLPVMVGDRVVGVLVHADLLRALTVLFPASHRAPDDAEIRSSILAELNRHVKTLPTATRSERVTYH